MSGTALNVEAMPCVDSIALTGIGWNKAVVTDKMMCTYKQRGHFSLRAGQAIK